MYPDGRLAEVVFWQPSDQVAYLKRLGLDVQDEDGQLVVRREQMTVGIPKDSDPVNTAVCLGLAMFDVYWPQVVPNLLREVEQEWTRRRKRIKSESEED